MAQYKTLFIVNPAAGKRTNRNVQDLINMIRSNASATLDYEIKVWERLEQRDEIISMVHSGRYGLVVAVGGDGTINMVGKAAVEAGVRLGIIPMGSGNGLARHLQIPLEPGQAIAMLGDGKEMTVDSCEVNGIHYMCTAGVGFDALIGNLFATSTKRGFRTYCKITVGQLLGYKPQRYVIEMDGRTIERKAFLITFANASQYGNNAYIAPQADIQDNYLDVCILKPFPLWRIPGLALRMFRKNITRSPYYEAYRVKNVHVSREEEGPVHYDGEPVCLGKEIDFKVRPSALRVIVPAAVGHQR